MDEYWKGNVTTKTVMICDQCADEIYTCDDCKDYLVGGCVSQE